MKSTIVPLPVLLCSLISLTELIARADTTYTINNTTADAFVASGSASNPVGTDLTGLNFGAAGTLAISSASSLKGEFDSVIKFNLASAVSQFNTTYGAGQWQITGLSLQLASNFGTQGVQPNSSLFNKINAGSFGIQWLSNDSWTEGSGGGMGTAGFPSTSAVSFNSIPALLSGLHDPLGIYGYTPPGNNVYTSYTLPLNANLVADAKAGGDVTFYFSAADTNVNFLFNSRTFASNHPEFTLSATAVPEPKAWAVTAVVLGVFAAIRRKKV